MADVRLTIDTGGPEPAQVGESMNMTSNVWPMWQRALGGSIRELDGLTGTEALPRLDEAIEDMQINPEVYAEMNPANGWGDSDGACRFLKELAKACRRHPRATVRVC